MRMDHAIKTISAGRAAGRRMRCEAGSVLIETALAYMLGMTMVLGIVELSMMCYTLGVVGEAARVGVRYAIVHGADSAACSGPTTGCGDPGGTNVANQVTAFTGSFAKNASGMSVTVTYPDSGGATPPSRVQIAVVYTYRPMFAVGAMSPVFHVAEQGRIVY